MRDLILSLFGTYTPVTFTDVDCVDVIPAGLAGVDWVWIGGLFLFSITLYCVFRILGGWFKK